MGKKKNAAKFVGLDPREPFTLSVMAEYADGSIGDCAYRIHSTEKQAAADVVCELEAHGGTWYLYECRPIAKINRRVHRAAMGERT